MRLSDRYLVQGPYDGHAVLVDDSTGAEQSIPLSQESISRFMTELHMHPPTEPYRFGAIEVPPDMVSSVSFAVGYFYCAEAYG